MEQILAYVVQTIGQALAPWQAECDHEIVDDVTDGVRTVTIRVSAPVVGEPDPAPEKPAKAKKSTKKAA